MLLQGIQPRYRVVVTEPSGKTLWTDINVTENGFSSRTYRVDCFGGGATLSCRGESRFVYDDHMGPGVWFGTPSGPSGYTFCSPDEYRCDNLPRESISVA